jgi:FkbM family methyltransferase
MIRRLLILMIGVCGLARVIELLHFVSIEQCEDKPKSNDLPAGNLPEFNECLKTVLHDNNLPIGYGIKKRGQEGPSPLIVWPHHLGAHSTGKWNEDLRFKPLPFTTESDCVIWEVGANTEARDSQIFMKDYPFCEYHAYEPIPSFFQTLETVWKNNIPLENQQKMHLHNYGLANKDTSFFIGEDVIAGQSTFLGAKKTKMQRNGTAIPIQIMSFDTAVQHAGGKKPTLLHINCEGCEWDLLLQAVQTGFIRHIEVLQFGTHNYGSVGLGARVWQLCEIRSLLSRTHRMQSGVPFGWERWLLRV